MLFNSIEFLIFFAVVLTAYWRLPHRAQNIFLLAASLFFYGFWSWKLLPLIVVSGTIDWWCGRRIAGADAVRTKKRVLAVSVCANLGILGFFKYYNFFVESFAELLSLAGLSSSPAVLEIILPVGISFYTFQSMSYTIDVYRGKLAPCDDFLDFLLYVSFFPQLVAGPIERAARLLPRIQRPRRRLTAPFAVEGLKLILIGFFQKVAIADSLAPIVDVVYSRPAEHDSVAVAVATYAFAIQIYCDFSGYSKIARGVARLLGFELMVNFRQPYFAASVTEFWRRWHISLSTWLRDYLYIPLGGNRRGRGRTYVNLMATMVLGGLWHGASWNFVVWGAIHGVCLAVHRGYTGLRGRGGDSRGPTGVFTRVASVLVTFHLVTVAWVFFRARTFEDAIEVFSTVSRFEGRVSLELAVVGIYATVFLLLDAFLERARLRRANRLQAVFSRHWAGETVVFSILLVLTMLIGPNDEIPFLYFQF